MSGKLPFQSMEGTARTLKLLCIMLEEETEASLRFLAQESLYAAFEPAIQPVFVRVLLALGLIYLNYLKESHF